MNQLCGTVEIRSIDSNVDFLLLQLYIRSDPSERSEDNAPIVKVRQSHEPRSFKRLFPSWDDAYWEVSA